MDYLNCKDLPVWAQILLHPTAAVRSRAEDEHERPYPPELSETVAAV